MYEFISYSKVDGRDFASKLCTALEANSITVKTHDDHGDQGQSTQFSEVVAGCHCFLLIITRESVMETSPCKQEWLAALQYKKPVILLLLSRDVSMPFRLMNRYTIDFTSNFANALDRLCNHLSLLRGPQGILLALQDRLIDAQRDLKNAQDELRVRRIEDEILQLETEIHAQQSILDDPQAALRRVGENIEQGLRQERQEEKQASSLPGVRIINPPPGVPPSYFQDRLAETKLLDQALRDDAIRMVLVVGRSGVGKTAVVCRLLNALKWGQLPDGGGTFTVHGIVYLSTLGSRRITLHNICTDLSQLLPVAQAQKAQGLLKEPYMSAEAKMRSFLSYFSTEKIMLLLDNFEDLVDVTGKIIDPELDESLRALLTVPHHGVKTILTTRIAPKGLRLIQPGRQEVIELAEGLQSPFAENLLREMDKEDRIGLKSASQELLTQAQIHTQGYPRALEALFATLSADRDASLQDILKGAASRLPEAIVEALVGEAFKRLDSYYQKTMQALAIYHLPVTTAAINYLLQPYLPGMDVTMVLRRLVDMYFVRREAGRYYLHPADRNYALGRIPRGSPEDRATTQEPPFTQFALFHRAADYFWQARKPRTEWKTIEDLAPQLSEFNIRCAGEEYNAAARLLDEIDHDHLQTWGYANFVRSLREILENKIQESQLQINQAKSLGNIYATLGSLDKSIAYHQQMLNSARTAGDQQSEVYALNRIANAYRRLARYAEAITYSHQALAIALKIPDPSGQADILANLGSIYWSQGHYDEALEYQNKALRITRETHNRRGEGYALGGLGSSYLSLRELTKAFSHYYEGLSVFQRIGYRQGEAYILEHLGRACLVAIKLDEAIRYSLQAVDIHVAISNQRGEGHTAFNLAHIYHAKHELQSALEYAVRSRDKLTESRVPEAITAQALVGVVIADLAGDRYGEARSLLLCAQNPPNSGDLRESLDFANEALELARADVFLSIENEAQAFIDKYLRQTARKPPEEET